MSTRLKIALATYYDAKDLIPEDRPLIESFRYAGIEAEPRIWNDTDVMWRNYDCVVLRTCWDYFRNIADFTNWLSSLATKEIKVLNPIPIVRWNLNKRYLKELEHLGIPIIPTILIEKNSERDLSALLDILRIDRAVLKPAISAWANNTFIVKRDSIKQGQWLLDRMLGDGEVLLQEFVDEINTEGEWSAIYFDGIYSHAVLKKPAFNDFRVQHKYGGTVHYIKCPEDVINVGEQILRLIPFSPIYARIDGCRTRDGFKLMELELIEPLLFLQARQGAETDFVLAVKRHLSND